MFIPPFSLPTFLPFPSEPNSSALYSEFGSGVLFLDSPWPLFQCLLRLLFLPRVLIILLK